MIQPNEPVFPIQDEYAGLTKREYFAALAMQGLLSNEAYHNPSERHKMITTSGLCQAAINYANAIIEELNKKQP